jgi:endonuclease/exonuclease/phosphatase family metal-dependent hydrolase
MRVLAQNVLGTPMDVRQVLRGDPPDPWRFAPGALDARLAGYDVLGLCEVFVSDARAMCARLGMPTRIEGPAARRATELGAGVEIHSTLPRSPRRRVVRHHYAQAGVGWDGFAAKGFLLAWLETPAGPLAVGVTHLQARHEREATRARARQIREIRRTIDRHAPDDACLLLGDLNVDGNDPDDPGTDLLHALFGDFTDAAVEAGRAEPTWNPRTNPRADGGTHRYDFVLYRSGAVRLSLVDADLALTERVRGTCLSDHYGVAATFRLE